MPSGDADRMKAAAFRLIELEKDVTNTTIQKIVVYGVLWCFNGVMMVLRDVMGLTLW